MSEHASTAINARGRRAVIDRLLPDPLSILDALLSALDRIDAAVDRTARKVSTARNGIAARRWDDAHDDGEVPF